jgi:hypothetical protein
LPKICIDIPEFNFGNLSIKTPKFGLCELDEEVEEEVAPEASE